MFSLALYFFNQGAKDKKPSMNMRFKSHRFRNLRDDVKGHLSDDSVDDSLMKSGIKLSSLTYNLIRYFVLIIWLLVIVVQKFKNGYLNRFSLIILIITIFVTLPQKELLGRKSPFYFVLDILQNKFNYRKSKEIYVSLSLLKSLSIVSSDRPIGSDYILEELMRFSRITRPIFSKFLSMWYEGDRCAACEYFADAIGTKEGRDLANLFMKLDELNPSELIQQIELYQTTFKSERITAKEKRNETRGTLLYALVMFSAFVVLINFVIVVITIDALNYYNGIFN